MGSPVRVGGSATGWRFAAENAVLFPLERLERRNDQLRRWSGRDRRVALGLSGTMAIGLVVFALQAKLPYKKMLIVTGIMIGAVLLQMVGNTAHVMQVVGWLPIHPIRSVALPYWSGMWFGLYATWEGIALQAAAATFVIGSYFLAERVQRREARQTRPGTALGKA
jgi:hypothetical protein